MGAVVDNAVHVEVQAIELRNPILRNKLGDSRISFAHPSEELWYTHLGPEACALLLERGLLVWGG